jgi:hypothetical protein
MLPIRGVNDSGNVTPSIPAKTGPSDCDKATATTDSNLAGVSPSSNGGGGGGTKIGPQVVNQNQVPPDDGTGVLDIPTTESGKGTIISWEPVD